MAMSIISVFALAYPMPPIYYIVRVAAWPLPLPPCPALKPAFMQYRRALPCWGAVLTVHTGQPARKPRSTSPHQTHQKSPAHLTFCAAQPFPFPSHPPPPIPSLRGYNPSPLALPLAVPRLPHLHGVYSHPLMTL